MPRRSRAKNLDRWELGGRKGDIAKGKHEGTEKIRAEGWRKKKKRDHRGSVGLAMPLGQLKKPKKRAEERVPRRPPPEQRRGKGPSKKGRRKGEI